MSWSPAVQLVIALCKMHKECRELQPQQDWTSPRQGLQLGSAEPLRPLTLVSVLVILFNWQVLQLFCRTSEKSVGR